MQWIACDVPKNKVNNGTNYEMFPSYCTDFQYQTTQWGQQKSHQKDGNLFDDLVQAVP